ncbi:sigma-70 family RNA polymerase sigma factor [Mycobacterium yunnanensis]|uniref:RNA polymerase sigma factor n=1 Tax=Mycobacterium yunnanensis TaxID=368477 RepID=A0A9X3BRR6_9MYCO|nr:RNA polymerase sigma factor [Mycobacterium yunnanensis]MCV7419255.1 sigma-70 family RNA polymerase sigma factor [Mycobacterium yunnanensis]
MTNETTDRSTNLIRLSGDFEQDVLPFRAQLYRFALSRTKNTADAEDLLQDTLLAAFKAYDDLQPDSHLKSWLMTIMRNTWIDRHRMATRRPVQTHLDEVTESTAPALHDERSAERCLLDDDFDPDVVAAMGSLSETMRETVFLVAVMGLDSQDAARVLGVSPGTVLTRMHRSRHALRKHLASRGPESRVDATGAGRARSVRRSTWSASAATPS